MRNYVYAKGSHLIETVEVGELAKVKGLSGWIDPVELMTLLLENGYNLVK